jgi:hypothetical protein
MPLRLDGPTERVGPLRRGGFAEAEPGLSHNQERIGQALLHRSPLATADAASLLSQ